MLRALVGFAVLAAFLAGMFGAALNPGCQLASRGADQSLKNANARVMIAAHHHHEATPDAGAFMLPQSCPSAVALPVSIGASGAVEMSRGLSIEHLANIVASHDPQRLFRPPRLS